MWLTEISGLDKDREGDSALGAEMDNFQLLGEDLEVTEPLPRLTLGGKGDTQIKNPSS